MILGYEMFRNLTSGKHIKKESLKEKFKEYLLDPGKSAVYVITDAHSHAQTMSISHRNRGFRLSLSLNNPLTGQSDHASTETSQDIILIG